MPVFSRKNYQSLAVELLISTEGFVAVEVRLIYVIKTFARPGMSRIYSFSERLMHRAHMISELDDQPDSNELWSTTMQL